MVVVKSYGALRDSSLVVMLMMAMVSGGWRRGVRISYYIKGQECGEGGEAVRVGTRNGGEGRGLVADRAMGEA